MAHKHSFLTSLRHALRGIRQAAREERNIRRHALIALIVVVLSVVLGVSPLEKTVLFLAIALTLVLEFVNSIVERIADMVEPRLHRHVGELKDIMAGAVLVAAVASAVIGVMIFWPYLT